MHEYLTRLGYELQPHPEISGQTTHPDFLVHRNGVPAFYLEAIVPQNRQITPGDTARLNQIHDTLQNIHSPDFFLWVQHSGYPSSVPSLKTLVKRLNNWIESLDYEAVVQEWHSSQSFDRLPLYQTDIAGMTLTLQPCPKFAARNKEGARSIGSFGPAEAKAVDTTTTIRRAVVAKSGKYGKLHLPYVLAVNVIELFVHLDDATAALFGREAIEVNYAIDGSIQHTFTRIPDGSWTTEQGPAHDNISAVLFWEGVHPGNLASVKPVLIHHPFPANSFTSNLPVKQISANSLTGMWSVTDEKAHLSTVLNLPTPWPVQDKDT